MSMYNFLKAGLKKAFCRLKKALLSIFAEAVEPLSRKIDSLGSKIDSLKPKVGGLEDKGDLEEKMLEKVSEVEEKVLEKLLEKLSEVEEKVLEELLEKVPEVKTAEKKMINHVNDKFDYMRRELAHAFDDLNKRFGKLEKRLSNK